MVVVNTDASGVDRIWRFDILCSKLRHSAIHLHPVLAQVQGKGREEKLNILIFANSASFALGKSVAVFTNGAQN